MLEKIPVLSQLLSWFDSLFYGFAPSTIIILTLLIWYITRKILSVVRFVREYEGGGVIAALIELVFPYLMKSSFATSKLTAESKKLLKQTITKYSAKEVQEYNFYELPEEGVEPSVVLQRMRNYIKDYGDHSYEDGTCSGSVYMSKNEEHLKAFNEAYSIFSPSNPLHYDLFPALCKFEREIVRFTRHMMHGDSKVKGLVTSGGTESLMLSIKAYRDYYRKHKPWIRKPEIIAMESIHAAVDKGCHLLCVKLRKVRVNRTTFTATPKEVEKLVTENTIAIYISAPCYPFGIIDDVEGIAKIAKKYKIHLHVDSCLGGFYCPFAYRIGTYGIPKFDFQVDGVTSMSADTHKYGMAPKGTSVLLFKNIELRNSSYYVQMKWQGGLYGTPTFGGSRSGGVIAACWAALMINGFNGYMEQAKSIGDCAIYIRNGVNNIKGLKTAGHPPAMVINIMTDEKAADFSVFQVMDEMKKHGWKCQGTQNPQGFHFCITNRSSGMGKKFVSDLEEAVENVMKNPKLHMKDSASLYGIAGYAPAEFLGQIGTSALSWFLDGHEKEDLKKLEEEEEEMKKEK